MTLNAAAAVSSQTSIGQRIRESRKHNGFTLQQLAKIASVHINTISGIESGKTVAKRGTLQRICDALGLTIEQVEGKTPASTPDDSSVAVFLEQYLDRVQEALGWPRDELGALMRRRFLKTGIRLGIVKDEAAQYFANQVTKQFRLVSELFELFDHDSADVAVTTIDQEYSKLHQRMTQVNVGNSAPPPTAKTLQMLVQHYQSGQ